MMIVSYIAYKLGIPKQRVYGQLGKLRQEFDDNLIEEAVEQCPLGHPKPWGWIYKYCLSKTTKTNPDFKFDAGEI